MNYITEFNIDTQLFSRKAYNALMLTTMLEGAGNFVSRFVHSDKKQIPSYSKSQYAFQSYSSIWNCIKEVPRNFTDGALMLAFKAPGTYHTGSLLDKNKAFHEFAVLNVVEQTKKLTLALRKTLKFIDEYDPSNDEVLIKTPKPAYFDLHTFREVDGWAEEKIEKEYGFKCRQYIHVVQKSTYKVIIALFSGTPIEKIKKTFGAELVDSVIGQPFDPFKAAQLEDIYNEEKKLSTDARKKLEQKRFFDQHTGEFESGHLWFDDVVKLYMETEAKLEELEESIYAL